MTQTNSPRYKLQSHPSERLVDVLDTAEGFYFYNMNVGSLVECINGSFEPRVIELIPNRPKQGKIYTIRGIKQYPNKSVGVLLEEIINEPLMMPDMEGLFEPTFNIERFRELPEANIEELIEELELTND